MMFINPKIKRLDEILGVFLLIVIIVIIILLVIGPRKTGQNLTKAQRETRAMDQKLDEIYAIDADLDGLTNEEEKTLGTDPNSSDTDEDGINDKTEIEKYGTDPLNPDTDGNGVKDGREVLEGRSPSGEGELLQSEINI